MNQLYRRLRLLRLLSEVLQVECSMSFGVNDLRVDIFSWLQVAIGVVGVSLN